MTLTLRFALQFAFAAALTVALAVGASFALFALRIDDTAGAMRDSLSSALESRLRAESARALEQAVAATENALAAGDRMALMAAAMEARLTGPAETVRLYGPDGRALADGAGDPSAFERPAPAPVRGARLEDGVRTWRDGSMLYSGRAVCPGGDCVGLVVVAVDASEATEAQAEADDALEEAKSALWLMGAGLVVLAVLAGAAISGSIGSALARRFSRSMEAAVDALEKISAGETGVSVPTRDAHLADLAHAVDMVAVAMAEATAKGETPEQSPFIADIPDGLFVAALSGEMLVANPALHALFGAEDGSLAGADVFETFGAERVEGAEAMSEALRTIGAITRPDGATVPVVLSVRPTGGGEDMRVVGVAREADPQPAIDPEAFAEAEKRAEAAKEAKEKFLSVMSHELRTPLNGILGGAAVLAGTELSDSQRGFLSLVQNSGSRMLALVTDILDYSRSEGDAPSPLHAAPAALEHLAQEIADGVSKDAAAKGLDLYVRVQPGLPPVLADVEAVLGIGEQFAQNAVKFTETGHVGVEITHRPADDGRLEISLAVDDSGPGVSVDIQKTMFDAFAMGDDSARRATGGTGLGLSIAQRLAKRLGGEIHVATAARGGSTFRVDFTVRTDGPAPPLSAALSGVRAVIVDETAGARIGLAETLRFAGADVDEAADLREAAPLKAKAPFDLIVTRAKTLESAQGSALMALLGDVDRTATLARVGPDDGAAPETANATLTSTARSDQALEAALIALAGVGRAAGDAEPALETVEGGADAVRVLLADHDDVTSAVLDAYLRQAGFEVRVARDGMKAVSLYKTFQPQLVLMDLAMPVMSGIEASKAIRRHEKASASERAPILGFIGKTRDGERERCANAGVDDFLAKPVRTEELETKIARWLDLDMAENEAAAI